jgi:dihydrofolate reductase
MGRVIVHLGMSIDGFMEGPDADISWHRMDAELHQHINDELRGVATYLEGRRSYELMQAYWPTADEDPDAEPEIRDFAQLWRTTPKVIASRTLEAVAPGDRLVRDVDAELVRSLAAHGDVAVGGADLAGQVLAMGVVDVLRIYVHPVAIGAGTRLLPPGLDLDLHLDEARAFSNGVVLLRYSVIGPARVGS